MRKSHFNDEFLVLLGPIISRLFTCSNEGKNEIKKQRVLALVLSLWGSFCGSVEEWKKRNEKNKDPGFTSQPGHTRKVRVLNAF
jgi:hypothetical protein